jgi:protocatechuate 3,4-dioxygenase beta subunit
MLTATPGQTVGPFFGYALPFERGSELVPPGSPNAIRLHGTVTDGDGKPVPDALLEIWQADAEGNVPMASGALKRDGWTFTALRLHDGIAWRTIHFDDDLRPRIAEQTLHPRLSAWL